MAFTEEDDAVIWDWAAQQVVRRLTGHLSTVTWVVFWRIWGMMANCV
jgi:hypothetical protein